MKMTNISIDNLKEKMVKNELDLGIYDGENGSGQKVTIIVDIDKFAVSTKQSNGWNRINIYEYDRKENQWIEEETYEKDND